MNVLWKFRTFSSLFIFYFLFKANVKLVANLSIIFLTEIEFKKALLVK